VVCCPPRLLRHDGALQSIEQQILADIEREAIERGLSEAEIARLLRDYAQALCEGREQRLAGTRLWIERELSLGGAALRQWAEGDISI
jgi:hypothetical protein